MQRLGGRPRLSCHSCRSALRASYGLCRHPPTRLRTYPSAAFSSAESEPETSPKSSLPQSVLDNLRGMGQVVFCNSAASGALIIGGLFAGDLASGSVPMLGCMSLISLTVQSLASRCVRATGLARHLTFDAYCVCIGSDSDSENRRR